MRAIAMHDVKITALIVRDFPPISDGRRILAHFDCELMFGAVLVRGCSLVKTAKGGFTVWPPRSEVNPIKSSVTFKADDLIAAMMSAARHAYRAMGGTEAEWSPRAQSEAA